jgi:NADPH-dependent curcumin reductase CurA
VSTQRTGREVRLAARPQGWPTDDTFSIAEVEVPEPAAGQVLVRNVFMSVDPYMRGRMNDAKSYMPPFQVGAALDGGAVGEVIESNSPDVKAGEFVLHGLGWREYAVLDAARAKVLDPAAAPSLSAHLGVLGMPGLTAYAGLFEVANFTEGETVFVSGAAGAVGSLVGQFAKLRGAERVIGSAGSSDKARRLVEVLGFDAAFNYKDAPIADQLAAAAPEGIDVYFDNVGGDHLEAAINVLKVHGRAALCGAIAQYNDVEAPTGPRNLIQVIGKRLTLRGLLVGDHNALAPQFVTEVGGWLRDGKLVVEETVVNGIENAQAAFLGLLRGENTGKMIVKL